MNKKRCTLDLPSLRLITLMVDSIDLIFSMDYGGIVYTFIIVAVVNTQWLK